MTLDTPNSFHAIIRGRVQGVGFRVFTREAALRLGLTGWVRNLPTGEVEVQAEGDENTLTELLTELSAGPPWSHVSDIDIQWAHTSERCDHFRIRR